MAPLSPNVGPSLATPLTRWKKFSKPVQGGEDQIELHHVKQV